MENLSVTSDGWITSTTKLMLPFLTLPQKPKLTCGLPSIKEPMMNLGPSLISSSNILIQKVLAKIYVNLTNIVLTKTLTSMDQELVPLIVNVTV